MTRFQVEGLEVPRPTADLRSRTMEGHSGTREGGVAPLDVTVTPWPARLQPHKHRLDGPGRSAVNPSGRPNIKKIQSSGPGVRNLRYFGKQDASATSQDLSAALILNYTVYT